MRGPSLQKTTALSFVLHLTVFLLFLLVFRQSSHMVMPDHYTVNLVSANVLPKADRLDNDNAAVEQKRETLQKKESAAASESHRKNIEENKKEDARERESIEKKISLMAAKERLEKQFGARKIISLKAGKEKLVRSAKGSPAKTAASKAVSSPVTTKGVAQSDDYYSRVIDEIRQQWVWTSGDSGRRNIEAVVSIRILRDGTAIIQRWEKKSGDLLFDKSALRALAKASPLTPPPYEMEIGVRFYP